MQLKQLFNEDDRAVSPVIGVILMVAITVILAAVIGSFVLGLGNSVQQTSPNANFQFDFDNQGNLSNGGADAADEYFVTATHTGGDTLNGDNTGSLVLQSPDTVTSATNTVGLPVSAGDTLTIDNTTVNQTGSAPGDAQLPESGDTIRVIWTSTNGESSQALAEDQVP